MRNFTFRHKVIAFVALLVCVPGGVRWLTLESGRLGAAQSRAPLKGATDDDQPNDRAVDDEPDLPDRHGGAIPPRFPRSATIDADVIGPSPIKSEERSLTYHPRSGDATALEEKLAKLLRGRRVSLSADPRTNSVTVRGTEDDLEEVYDILETQGILEGVDTLPSQKPVQESRQFVAVPDSPVSKESLERLHAEESAAASEAETIRQLRTNGKADQHRQAITVHQQNLERHLSTAFDLKLQLEELQVKDLQARLSRLERQVDQRKQLRVKIISRRATELIERDAVHWDSSQADPTRPSSIATESKKTTPVAMSPPTQVCLSGPDGMQISIGGAMKNLGTPARYYIQRQPDEIRRISLVVQFAPGSGAFLAGRLDLYPSDTETASFLENNAVPFSVSEQDTLAAWNREVITKVVLLRSSPRQMPRDQSAVKKRATAQIETLDSLYYGPKTDLIREAGGRGKILAVLHLARDFGPLGIPDPNASAILRSRQPETLAGATDHDPGIPPRVRPRDAMPDPAAAISIAGADDESTIGLTPVEAVAIAGAADALTIMLTAAEDGQVASLSLGYVDKNGRIRMAKQFDGPLDVKRLMVLDRQLHELLTEKDEPCNRVLMCAQKSLKYEELLKVIGVCQRQKTADGKPITVSFVDPEGAPQMPDAEGALKRERNTGERELARVEKILKLVEPLDLPHLAIGRFAPDIEANNLSGQRMTLREYRGKVVLLVFWSSSCGPCMGDVPHENSLVERFAGRPFALVGVNCDESIAKALAAVEKHSIPWKSFWNGEGGGDGPITEQWGVLAWPTVYVLDDAGVIRHKNLRGDALDAPLERLIATAEARGNSAAKPKRTSQFRTGENVKTIACSADGKLIAVANGNPTFILQENGRSRVVDDWKPSVEILDAETGKPVVLLKLTTSVEDALFAAAERVPDFEVEALAFSPDGNVVAVGTNVGQVKLFNARTGILVRSLDDERAKFADKETPEKLKPLTRALGSVASLAFSPDGSLLATCGGSFHDVPLVSDGISELGRSVTSPGRLKVWEVKTGTLKHDLVGHAHANAVAFSPDGSLLASAGSWEDDRERGTGAILWNPESGNKIRTMTNNENGGTWSVAFSPDSKLLAIGSLSFDKDKDNDASTRAISLARVATGIIEWRRTYSDLAKPVAFFLDGDRVLVLHGGQTMELLDAETGRVWAAIEAQSAAQGGRCNDFVIGKRGHMLAIGGVDSERKGSVEVWDLETSGEAR